LIKLEREKKSSPDLTPVAGTGEMVTVASNSPVPEALRTNPATNPQWGFWLETSNCSPGPVAFSSQPVRKSTMMMRADIRIRGWTSDLIFELLGGQDHMNRENLFP
jgi:hypothetical protein